MHVCHRIYETPSGDALVWGTCINEGCPEPQHQRPAGFDEGHSKTWQVKNKVSWNTKQSLKRPDPSVVW